MVRDAGAHPNLALFTGLSMIEESVFVDAVGSAQSSNHGGSEETEVCSPDLRKRREDDASCWRLSIFATQCGLKFTRAAVRCMQ